MALPSRWKETHQFGWMRSKVSDHPVQRVLVNKFGEKASVNEPRVLFSPPQSTLGLHKLTNRVIMNLRGT
nr:MAG TPA: hypothetical protein [Caudoviricetes sp.]